MFNLCFPGQSGSDRIGKHRESRQVLRQLCLRLPAADRDHEALRRRPLRLRRQRRSQRLQERCCHVNPWPPSIRLQFCIRSRMLVLAGKFRLKANHKFQSTRFSLNGKSTHYNQHGRCLKTWVLTKTHFSKNHISLNSGRIH